MKKLQNTGYPCVGQLRVTNCNSLAHICCCVGLCSSECHSNMFLSHNTIVLQGTMLQGDSDTEEDGNEFMNSVTNVKHEDLQLQDLKQEPDDEYNDEYISEGPCFMTEVI